MNEIKYCQYCGAQIAADSAFCEKCGKKLDTENTESTSSNENKSFVWSDDVNTVTDNADLKICRTCGKSIDARAKICTNCGASQYVTVPAKLKKCKNCGGDMAGVLKKCPHCGKKAPSNILQGVCIAFGIMFFIGAIATFSENNSSKSPAQTTEVVDSSTVTPEPTPTPTPIPTEPPVSAEYKAALKKAKSYSDMMHMSKKGIYNQLTSEYGEKFPADAAQYAIDNLNADWGKNALEKAKSYRKTMSMSNKAIHDQLTSEYGEKFTQEEADYAIAHIDD